MDQNKEAETNPAAYEAEHADVAKAIRGFPASTVPIYKLWGFTTFELPGEEALSFAKSVLGAPETGAKLTDERGREFPDRDIFRFLTN